MVQGVISCCCCSIYIEVFTFPGLPRRLKWQRILLPMQEMRVWSLGQEEPLEEEMATHSSILAWKIPCTEEPGGLQSMGSQRVRHNWACACASAGMHMRARAHTHTHTHFQVFQHHLLFHIACGILGLWPGLKSVSPVSEGSLNHSTAREVHDPWMYLANCTHLLTFLTTCEILSFQNKILNEICLISNWLWYFPEGLWKITKSLFLHLVNERCYNN